ncbi:hypothetical protein AB1Y20_014880 [Prymnesium parvum]|uniref:Secreted protein n=1 Tax=Prymnesium parvum TaxID=97485 RepID=A0AB34JYZ0_PRYPA
MLSEVLLLCVLPPPEGVRGVHRLPAWPALASPSSQSWSKRSTTPSRRRGRGRRHQLPSLFNEEGMRRQSIKAASKQRR